ncbi:MAG: hypothetical protein ACRD0Q_01740 [Acidimicrobiales bacterium]
MEDRSQDRLRHVFPRLDVLAAPVRLQLSELLASPGSVPAVLAQEIADLPLPRTEAARRALRVVIEKGFGRDALALLGTMALSDVVPAIGTHAGGISFAGCPSRLRELLARQGAATWADLGALTLGAMARWTGVGLPTLAGLVGSAVEAALAAGPTPAGEEREDQAEPHQSESAALALLLHHDNLIGGTLRRALDAHASGDGPAEVRAAATRVLAAADRAGDPRLRLLDRVWHAAGDHRARGVLAHRALRIDAPTPTNEIAEALGLSNSQVLKIEARARALARDAVDGRVGELAAGLAGRLGSVGPIAAIDGALAALGLPARHDPRSALLVWLAGPYVTLSGHPGWVATDPAAVLAETRRLLHEDGGVRLLDHVVADLESAGIPSHDVGLWLGAQPVAVVDGLVVTRSGSPADVAERLLSATGRAMTVTELAAMVSRPNGMAISDPHLRRDPRFVRVDRDRFELAEWGGTAFTEPPAPGPELFPGAGHHGAPGGRSRLHIEVDAAVLRGAADAVPLSVVDALGLPCGGQRTFTTRFGPVALNHKAVQPTRGSVRPIALAAGATEGDLLLFEFDASTGGASVELVAASSTAAN